MCGEGGLGDISPKERRLREFAEAIEREGLTVKDLKALCEPGVLKEVAARLSGVNNHEKS